LLAEFGAGGGLRPGATVNKQEIVMAEGKTQVKTELVPRSVDLAEFIKTDLMPIAFRLVDEVDGAQMEVPSNGPDVEGESLKWLARISIHANRLLSDIRKLHSVTEAAKDQGRTITWEEKTELTVLVRTGSFLDQF